MPDSLDFIASWGREFCEALHGKAEACGQDAFEAWVMAFDSRPDIGLMRTLTDEQISRLRDAANALFEISEIEIADVKNAVQRTLSHCSRN